MLAKPTTAYLMTYTNGRCYANCGFCTQARESIAEHDHLSRVIWPKFNFDDVLNKLVESKSFKRVCIQTLIYPHYVEDSIEIITKIKSKLSLPISIAIYPKNLDDLKKLKYAGAERVGIGLDASTKELFSKIKPSFSWNRTLNLLYGAKKYFGDDHVSVHLIYGLGESDKDFIRLLFKLYRKGLRVGLFAFTPMKGTKLESHPPPNQKKYRAIQLALYLISNNLVTLKNFQFDLHGNIQKILVNKLLLNEIIESCLPFTTKGCPNCNRPFYNERPIRPLYNYPTLHMAKEDLKIIKNQLTDCIT